MKAQNLQLTGRFQQMADGALRCAWPGSQITLRFKGTGVDAIIKDLPKGPGGNHLAILIDNRPPVALALRPGRSPYRLAENLAPGAHTLRVFKQTEALVGSVEFTDFSCRAGHIIPPPPKPERRIEFIGDSITCGYGNEGSSPDESFKPSTENHFLSYGQLAARKLGAEAHVIAWSGEGILRNAAGDVVHPLPTLYDQVLPPSPAPIWDFSTWIPQVVVINLGTNDFLTGIPNRNPFIETYLQLLEKIDHIYHSPHIFCCLGPMMTGEPLAALRSYLHGISDRTNEHGSASFHQVEFDPLEQNELGADRHPNLAAHHRLAATLSTVVRNRTGWTKEG